MSDRAAPTTRHHSEAGQSTVEFALVLPVVAVLALGLVQVGLSVRNQLAVELAAREGARAASVAADTTGAATRAASDTTTLPITVTAQIDGDTVAVRVEFIDQVQIPLLGRFMGPLTHSATAVMALEPP